MPFRSNIQTAIFWRELSKRRRRMSLKRAMITARWYPKAFSMQKLAIWPSLLRNRMMWSRLMHSSNLPSNPKMWLPGTASEAIMSGRRIPESNSLKAMRKSIRNQTNLERIALRARKLVRWRRVGTPPLSISSRFKCFVRRKRIAVCFRSRAWSSSGNQKKFEK